MKKELEKMNIESTKVSLGGTLEQVMNQMSALMGVQMPVKEVEVEEKNEP